MTIKVYDIGDLVRATGTFTDANGAAVDPTTVTIRHVDPSGTVTAWVYGTDAEVVKDSTGNYHADIPADAAGVWRYRWEGTGAATAAGEKQFRVQDSRFS